MIFVLVEAEIKSIKAVPLKTATAVTTIDVLRGIFARSGLPETLVSDNCPQLFSSTAMARFLQEDHVYHLTTVPYHPQSNGLEQRAVRTIKEAMK